MSEKFPFDVFLSHSSKDDAVALELAERLKADGLRVWIDRWQIRPGEVYATRLQEGLDQSRNLVVLLSENSEISGWVVTEIISITGKDPLGRFRRVVPLHLDDSSVPAVVARFQNLSWKGKERLDNYEKVLAACGYSYRRPTILIAKPEESLLVQCDEVESYLTQVDEFNVVSAEHFNAGPGFEREFDEALTSADLFVQLLGSSPGRGGYVDDQSEAAHRRQDLQIMQWRNPEISLKTVTDQRHRKQLAEANIQTLNDFKRDICDRARSIQPASAIPVCGRYAVIVFERSDRQVAEEISKVCAQQKLSLVFPRTEGSAQDIRDDLRSHLLMCDVLIFVYGVASYEWIRGQLSYYLGSVSHQRKSLPRLVARYDGPPPAKPDPGITIYGAEVIDCTQQWNHERLRMLLGEIA